MPNKQTVRDRSKVKPQGEDAAFLVEEFDVTAREAAELVARDDEDADKVKDATYDALKGRDPLRNKPTPEAPASDLTADTDEVRLKPVVHKPNMRTSGG
jgi:hypothetical protein